MKAVISFFTLCLINLSLHLFSPHSGVRGNLQESERYVGANLLITGATLLLSVYFLVWQSYVLRADVIINAILLCIYGLCGVAGFGALARFTRLDFSLYMPLMRIVTKTKRHNSCAADKTRLNDFILSRMVKSCSVLGEGSIN